MRKTSIKTFKMIKDLGIRDVHKNRILATLYDMKLKGITGGTAHEIGAYSKLTVEQVDRRTSELECDGFIEVIGEGRSPYGYPANIYGITGNGIRKISKPKAA